MKRKNHIVLKFLSAGFVVFFAVTGANAQMTSSSVETQFELFQFNVKEKCPAGKTWQCVILPTPAPHPFCYCG
jgi:hypothetical protein